MTTTGQVIFSGAREMTRDGTREMTTTGQVIFSGARGGTREMTTTGQVITGETRENGTSLCLDFDADDQP